MNYLANQPVGHALNIRRHKVSFKLGKTILRETGVLFVTWVPMSHPEDRKLTIYSRVTQVTNNLNIIYIDGIQLYKCFCSIDPLMVFIPIVV